MSTRQSGDDSSPEHILALLHHLRRRTDADLAARLASIPGMRGSFGFILGTLPNDGARATEMAARMGVTKQSFGERVRELERRGWVESVPDPFDGRARLIRRTTAGEQIRDETEAMIESMELEWAEQVGRDRYEVFRSVLRQLGAPSLGDADEG